MRRLKFLGWIAAILVVVFGGSYLFAPQWLMKANFMREAMAAHLDTHSVQAGDTKWVYYEGGEGQTLVLLHGFADSKEVWLETAKLLTPHFHVIILISLAGENPRAWKVALTRWKPRPRDCRPLCRRCSCSASYLWVIRSVAPSPAFMPLSILSM